MIQTNTNTIPSPKKLAMRVYGPDACKFLQGQLTCDVAALQDSQSTLGAYCNIKGKVESLFTLRREGDAYILSMQAQMLQPTMQELQKYAVFSKVQLEACENQPQQEIDEVQEIRNKIPEIYPQTKGEFFPHDINLPQLGAVSFTKGCYRGQEIVARMQHRGKLKRSMYIFSCAATEVHPGDQVTTKDAAVAGIIVRACKTSDQIIGLAVITDVIAADQMPLYVVDSLLSLN